MSARRGWVLAAVMLCVVAAWLLGCGAPKAQPPRTARAGGTPTFTLAPAPTPTALLDLPTIQARAQAALVAGEMARAIPLWEQAAALAPRGERCIPRLALARANLGEGRTAEAERALRQCLDETQDAALRAEAQGLLGALYEGMGAWQQAAEAWTSYLAIQGAAAPYVRLHLARDWAALGEDGRALDALQQIGLDDLPAWTRAEILEELATTRIRLQDTEGALAAYEQILSFAQQPGYRALTLYRLAQTYAQAERPAEAASVTARLLKEYPETEAAGLALRALDDKALAQWTDLEQGRIYLAAGLYPEAEEALKAHLAARRATDKPQAQYLLGQVYTRRRDFAQAIPTYEAALQALWALKPAEQAAQEDLIAQTWIAQASAVAASGADAAVVYRAFADRYPAHARAPEALYRGAQWAESELGWPAAQEYYRTFGERYPHDERTPDARFREGLAAYAQELYDTAMGVWMEAWSQSANGAAEDRARALTWAGLAAWQQGDLRTAQGLWTRAAEAAPRDYYGLRSEDLIAGRPPVLVKNDVYPAVASPVLADADWDAAKAWVGSWYTPTLSITDTQRVEAYLARAQALGRIGWRSEADDAYVQARQVAHDHPAVLLTTARIAYAEGIYPQAIAAAEELIDLAAQAHATEAPPCVWRVAYPTVYGDLVQQQAQQYDLDPLLFLALMRQESRFDAQAASYIGAMGLTQVMPETGEWIAAQLKDAGYARELLTRPAVSVRYGAWYFDHVLDAARRDWMAALTGYNAGPGSMANWTGGKPISDHDLFYETIPYAETKHYVRTIYEQVHAYWRTYAEDTR